jgi:hypothetical protein
LRTLYHCPVWQVPYLWSPHFIEQRKLQTAQAGFEYGFKVPAHNLPTYKSIGTPIGFIVSFFLYNTRNQFGASD